MAIWNGVCMKNHFPCLRTNKKNHSSDTAHFDGDKMRPVVLRLIFRTKIKIKTEWNKIRCLFVKRTFPQYVAQFTIKFIYIHFVVLCHDYSHWDHISHDKQYFNNAIKLSLWEKRPNGIPYSKTVVCSHRRTLVLNNFNEMQVFY